MIGIAACGAVVVALCAFMAHGDDGSWIRNTLISMLWLGAVVGVLLLIAWVMTGPGESMWSSTDSSGGR
jgi:hypothetical protein